MHLKDFLEAESKNSPIKKNSSLFIDIISKEKNIIKARIKL